jgi:hypothetical protein
MPIFWLGIMLMILFADLAVLPPPAADPAHLVLPAITLGATWRRSRCAHALGMLECSPRTTSARLAPRAGERVLLFKHAPERASPSSPSSASSSAGSRRAM